jgi:phosphatidate phosphatase APP1
VSSSPWNLYKQFVGTMRNRGVPEGPVFLKDFGLDPGKFIKTGHHSHKLDRIAELLSFYPDLDFVLIGDSGQEDAEIYREAVRRYSTRIRAVFLRDVTDDARDRQVDLIVRDIEARGVRAWRVESTVEAAEAAASLGLIPEAAIEQVRRAAQDEETETASA